LRVGVYEHLAHGRPQPWEYTRWVLAKEFGWTLPEVDALSLRDMQQWKDIAAGRQMVAQRKKEKVDKRND